MPFPEQTARPFTRRDVEALKPNQTGVYGLFKANTWVYIGSGDIRGRLLDHLNGDNPRITREKPTHWVDAVVAGDPVPVEKQLISECDPVCNRRAG
jgi:hypothetical protein